MEFTITVPEFIANRLNNVTRFISNINLQSTMDVTAAETLLYVLLGSVAIVAFMVASVILADRNEHLSQKVSDLELENASLKFNLQIREEEKKMREQIKLMGVGSEWEPFTAG